MSASVTSDLTLDQHGVRQAGRDFVAVEVTGDGGVRIRTTYGRLDSGTIPAEGRRHLATLLNESATNEEIAERAASGGLPEVVGPAGCA